MIWYDLILKSKMFKITKSQILTIPKKIEVPLIVFQHCYDVHPLPLNESPIFEGAKKAIFLECEHNFLYYWLKPQLFPNLETVYADNLCDDEIYRFKKLDVFVLGKVHDDFHRRHRHLNIGNKDIKLRDLDEKHFKTFNEILNNIE